jgi:hypothetical protein
MKCILIFDHLNDILYAKYNRKFAKHARKLSREQGFMSDERVCGYVGELRRLFTLASKVASFF